MFSNLFFLILNLLLVSSIIDQKTSPFLSNYPGFAFSIFLISYPFLLFFLYRQCICLKHKFYQAQNRILFFINIEILLFFSCFYFFFGAERWLATQLIPFGLTFFNLFSLLLYFLALFICQYALANGKNRKMAFFQAWLSICFLIPFVIPFLVLAFLNEASSLFPIENIFQSWGVKENNNVGLTLFIFFNLFIILATLILLPPLAVLIWQCPQLEDPLLKKELDELCHRAHFKHAGFKIWRIMNNSTTAAIIGIISKLRYILFTQKLLNSIPNRSIVAILAHEIGHSYHHHLFFYPFILLGMAVIGSLAPILIYIPILQKTPIFEHYSSFIPMIMFCLFGITIALYFRFIFGYFSRLFERQADLHIFRLNIPAEDLINSLDILGTVSGNIHHEPNWHHYSIQERIDFINRANQDRSLIYRHSRLVRHSLATYFFILILSIILLWNLIS